METSYGKYVFDTEKRLFVGEFEKMYQQEEVEHYDSWSQEDLTQLHRQLALVLLGRHSFRSILDLGCGKGVFTRLLKKEDIRVVAVDVSETAIAKARAKDASIEFVAMDVTAFLARNKERFDLVTAMEVLSYMEGWRDVIKAVSAVTHYFLLTLYLPDDPIGFVKSFDQLRAAVARHFRIVTELLIDGHELLLLCEREGR